MRHVARSADALSFAHTFVRFEWLAYRYDSTLTSSSLPACWDRSQVTSLSLQNTFALFSRQITLAVSEVRMPSSCGANYLKIDPHEFDVRGDSSSPLAVTQGCRRTGALGVILATVTFKPDFPR
jgi:hypothetical protein